MRLWVAKICEHPITQVLCHEPTGADHGVGNASLIGRNDLPQIFGVQAGGKRRRTDQVNEYHRELTPLPGMLRRLRARRRIQISRKHPDRAKYLDTIAENDSEVF